MLFFISLLEPETEDPEDLLLRNALHPLAARAPQWGALIYHLIRRTININTTCLTSTAAPDEADRSRFVFFLRKN